MRLIEFEVIDNQTGEAPDCEKIALTEEWAKRLIYCDIDCFAITEDGNLILIDDCNNIAYPPSDRFTVKVDLDTLRPKGRKERSAISKTGLMCTNCYSDVDKDAVFCKYCGAKMEV